MAEEKKKILIVEDEPGVQITLEDRLNSEGYNVTVRGDGIEGEKEILTGNHDLVLLDVMMPGKDGFSVCRDVRKAGVETPILMLTARDTNIDTVTGLRFGADDYLPKPFDMQVLLARIEALLRRAASKQQTAGGAAADSPAGQQPEKVVFGRFILDRSRGLLEQKLDDGSVEAVELNAQEYKLLEYLAQHSGRIISRNAILDDVWGYESEITTRTVDVHIAKLRQRLGESEMPRHILTYRGRGYKFEL
ncbi:MAG: response regulator transcription factor [Spirochaetales bacterium]|uniref:Response regulator transcription factor n=1 Tax=Candidatus Thalassospirochaeta sargassi TaxID=3119039 RepID=A0AAJ1IEV1_9SPIO|nr:response regulator transcription factor [Spirochaetales bacterium]